MCTSLLGWYSPNVVVVLMQTVSLAASTYIIIAMGAIYPMPVNIHYSMSFHREYISGQKLLMPREIHRTPY